MKIRIGVTERVSKICVRANTRYFTVVHNITMPSAYSGFTVHICRINFEKAHFLEQQLDFGMTCHFSLMYVLQNRWFRGDPTSLTLEGSDAILILFEQAIHRK